MNLIVIIGSGAVGKMTVGRERKKCNVPMKS